MTHALASTDAGCTSLASTEVSATVSMVATGASRWSAEEPEGSFARAYNQFTESRLSVFTSGHTHRIDDAWLKHLVDHAQLRWYEGSNPLACWTGVVDRVEHDTDTGAYDIIAVEWPARALSMFLTEELVFDDIDLTDAANLVLDQAFRVYPWPFQRIHTPTGLKFERTFTVDDTDSLAEIWDELTEAGLGWTTYGDSFIFGRRDELVAPSSLTIEIDRDDEWGSKPTLTETAELTGTWVKVKGRLPARAEGEERDDNATDPIGWWPSDNPDTVADQIGRHVRPWTIDRPSITTEREADRLAARTAVIRGDADVVIETGGTLLIRETPVCIAALVPGRRFPLEVESSLTADYPISPWLTEAIFDIEEGRVVSVDPTFQSLRQLVEED